MLKREVTATFLGSAAGAVLSIGTFIILARLLGPSGRGILGLALWIPSMASTFCTLGQGTANMTFAGLYKDQRSSLFLQSLIMTIVGGLVSTLAACAFFFWLPVNKGEFGQLTNEMVWLACLATPILLLSGLLVSLVRGVGRITSGAVVDVAQKGFYLVLLVIFMLLLGYRMKMALLITAVYPVVAVGASIWLMRDFATLSPSKLSWWMFKKSLGFGTQISLAQLAGFLIYRIGQAILAYMATSEQIGLYVVSVQLAEQLRLIPYSISTAFLPRLANEISSRQSQVPMVFRSTTVVSIASMLLMIVFGTPAILILGMDYLGSIPSFLLLLPGIAVLGGSSILASDLASREKPKYSIWVSYVILATTVVLTLALIPVMGIAGAALASTISYIAAAAMWLVFYKRESKVPMREMIPTKADVKFVTVTIISMAKQTLSAGLEKFKRTGLTEAAK